MREIAASAAQNSSAAKEMIKLQTRYFDQVLSDQILQEYQQIVILGSGLDTLSHSKSSEAVTYFEIDDLAMV